MKEVKDIQALIDTKAERKLDKDWREFSDHYFKIFNDSCSVELLEEMGIRNEFGNSLNRHTLHEKLCKIFKKARKQQYLQRESSEFMNRFNRMSKEFDEMIGFCDGEENH